MKPLVLMCVIFAALGMSCSDDQRQTGGSSERDRQLAVLKSQNDAYQRQLDAADEAIKRAAEQDRRFDALLSKWEEQAQRYDAILDRWERMLLPCAEDKTISKEGT